MSKDATSKQIDSNHRCNLKLPCMICISSIVMQLDLWLSFIWRKRRTKRVFGNLKLSWSIRFLSMTSALLNLSHFFK